MLCHSETPEWQQQEAVNGENEDADDEDVDDEDVDDEDEENLARASTDVWAATATLAALLGGGGGGSEEEASMSPSSVRFLFYPALSRSTREGIGDS